MAPFQHCFYQVLDNSNWPIIERSSYGTTSYHNFTSLLKAVRSCLHLEHPHRTCSVHSTLEIVTAARVFTVNKVTEILDKLFAPF